MSLFRRLGEGLRVGPLLAQADACPDLWGEHPDRLDGVSPHRETSDIWIRYMEPVLVGRHDVRRPHASVWYPAAKRLDEVYDVILDARDRWGVEMELGGVLMTRLPAGKQVFSHHDRGSWHAEYYTHKAWVILRGNELCLNYIEDDHGERHYTAMRSGEAWTYDNQRVHGVMNGGATERICLIVCFRPVS